MLETLNQWLPIYTAAITTGLLVVIIVVLRQIVNSKNATIELLKERVEFWKEQNVSVVHQINEALRKEYKELYKEYIEYKKQQEEMVNEFKSKISQLTERLENPEDVSQWNNFNTLMSGEFYTPPPLPAPTFKVDENGNVVMHINAEAHNRKLAEGRKALAEYRKLRDSLNP